MIGSLRGRLLGKQPPCLVIEVQGLGYEVEAPMTTFYKLPALGAEVQLFTHLVIREDAHLLFGFASEDERRLFRALLKVNGVGAKLALAILSGIEAQEFALCVRQGDAERLVKLPGVGKKTAERLIVEMRDRLQDWDTSAAAGGTKEAPAAGGNKAQAEAESALIALGYKPQEASRLVQTVLARHDAAAGAQAMAAEELIRLALKTSMKR